MRAALIAALSTVALVPSAAFAQTNCEQRSSQVTGTVIGGATGALLGGAVAGKDDRAAGAIIGALGGALLGSQLSKPKKSNCNQAFGYYDNNGAWHVTDVDRTRANGFYDRNGQWVPGVPNGYYDDRGVWVAGDTRVRAAYYDEQDRYVPPGVKGYYDSGNRWVEVRNVRVDNRNRGNWDDWSDRPRDVRDQAEWLRTRIIRARDEGRITQRESRAFLADLQEITAREARMPRRRGELTHNDETYIQAQLDELRNDFREEARRG